MDPEPCFLNVAATTDPGFTYGDIIDEAVSRINGGNGVDIDEIADYVKERYELPKEFRKHLRDKLKKHVRNKKLDKVGNVYKTPEGAVTTEATNPTQSLNPEDSTKPQDLPNTPIVPKDMLKEFMEASEKMMGWAEYFELRAREICHFADRMDLLSDVIMDAVAESTIDSGNGVDINGIEEYIKERYQVVKCRNQLIAKLEQLVSENKLDEVQNRYKIHKCAATPKATNPTEIVNPDHSTKPVVSQDMLEKLTDKLKKRDSGNKVDEIPDGAVITEVSTKQHDLPTSSSALLDGAATTEATYPTQISNPEDSTKQQDLPSTPIIPEDMLKEFIDNSVRIIASIDYFESSARELSEIADIIDELCGHNHINFLFAEELYKQCKKGKQVPLVEFTKEIFEDWLLDTSPFSEFFGKKEK